MAHEVYAIKYASHMRTSEPNFMNPPDIQDGPMPIDYFVWLVRSDDHTFVVDTGFNAETAAERGREMAFAAGRYMRFKPFRHPMDVEHVVGMVRQVYRDRVIFHDGEAGLAPGVGAHHIGGHTAGLQFVRVKTRRGWMVLASGASHLYANMERNNPYPIVFREDRMLEGYGTLRKLADSPDHVIPGHDPRVVARYPAPSAALEGIAVRLG